MQGVSSRPPLTSDVGCLLQAPATDLGCRVAPLGGSCTIPAWHSRPLPLTPDVGKFSQPRLRLVSWLTVEVRNRFKGLDLIDRVPDELWNEVPDIVQETGIKTIPMEKKCKKANWLSGEALQIQEN